MPVLPNEYTIGTRGSLLAVAQSTLIKNSLEELTGDQFNLKTIKTQGDLDTSKPLWQLDGKDFFTKELDHALLANEVDLVIHSYKDLGSTRPAGIELACLTQRRFGEDILLIKKETVTKINSLETFTIGTSSPRRIACLQSLKGLFPNNKLDIKDKMLRGNVNTRIKKLKDGDYDAIILAMAGLERLSLESTASLIIEELLKDLDFMILPSSLFPSAAAQGALAIEVSSNSPKNAELKEKLSKLHHKKTAQEILIERDRFQTYGGGCHLAVGIHVEKRGSYFVQHEKGLTQGKTIDTSMILPAHNFEKLSTLFVGLPPEKYSNSVLDIVCDELIKKSPLEIESPPDGPRDVFITSSYTFKALEKVQPRSCWVSGLATWKKLAQKGYWINGSADSLGHEKLYDYLNSKVLENFYPDIKLATLSAKGSKVTKGELIECYQRETKEVSNEYKERLMACKAFYWTSFAQYEIYSQEFDFLKDDTNLYHCCGLGKTMDSFSKSGMKFLPFSSVKDFVQQFTI